MNTAHLTFTAGAILAVAVGGVVIQTHNQRAARPYIKPPSLISPAERGDKRLNFQRGVPAPSRSVILFEAICQVESGGDNLAIGDGGRSKGPYQISLAYWQDACEHNGSVLKYDLWVWDAGICEWMMDAYWQRYGATTDEEKARIHNGGPRGMIKESTKAYWNKVKEAMK